MNIYELDALIECLESKHEPDHSLIKFYNEMRLKLLVELGDGIREIIANA